MKELPASLSATTMTAQPHDDSSSRTSCSSASVSSLSIDNTTQYDEDDCDDSTSRFRRNRSSTTRRASSRWWWCDHVRVFLICSVTVALVVLLCVYCSHRLLFSSHKARTKAAEKQATEKKHKKQMYWHKAIERHLLPSNKKCQESREEDSHGTLIRMSEHDISNLWPDSSSNGIATLRHLQQQLLQLQQQQQQPQLNRGRASNSNIRVRKEHVTKNAINGSNTNDSNGMTYEGGTFYAIRSTMFPGPGATFHADIEELVVAAAIPTEDEAGDEILQVVNSCPFEFQFGTVNTGFEGMTLIRDLNNDLVMLVVCQGNHCSEDKNRRKERGNGVVLVMKKEQVNANNENDDAGMSSSSSSCQWSAIRALNLPSSAFFEGYSNIAITPQTGRVAVASSIISSSSSSSSTQKENKVWVGKLLGRNKDGQWDIDSMEFEPEESAVYGFPKDEDCQYTFSHMKGLDWIDDKTLVTSMVDKVQAHPTYAILRIPESSSSKR